MSVAIRCSDPSTAEGGREPIGTLPSGPVIGQTDTRCVDPDVLLYERIIARSPERARVILARHDEIIKGRSWVPEGWAGRGWVEIKPDPVSVKPRGFLVRLHLENVSSWDNIIRIWDTLSPAEIAPQINSLIAEERCESSGVSEWERVLDELPHINLPPALRVNLEEDLAEESLSLWWLACQRMDVHD